MDMIKDIFKPLGKIILLAITCLSSFSYIVALSEKIEHPNMKNLPIKDFIIMGFVIVLLIFLNLKVFKILKERPYKK